jgi:hypothetical protein
VCSISASQTPTRALPAHQPPDLDEVLASSRFIGVLKQPVVRSSLVAQEATNTANNDGLAWLFVTFSS